MEADHDRENPIAAISDVARQFEPRLRLIESEVARQGGVATIYTDQLEICGSHRIYRPAMAEIHALSSRGVARQGPTRKSKVRPRPWGHWGSRGGTVEVSPTRDDDTPFTNWGL